MCYSTSSHIWTFVTPWPPQRRHITTHYDSQFCVSFHFCLLQEAQKRRWMCLNGAEKQFSSFQIFIGVSYYKWQV